MEEVSGTRALNFQGLSPSEAKRRGQLRCGCCCETGNSEMPSSGRFGSGEWGAEDGGTRAVQVQHRPQKRAGVSGGRQKLDKFIVCRVKLC